MQISALLSKFFVSVYFPPMLDLIYIMANKQLTVAETLIWQK